MILNTQPDWNIAAMLESHDVQLWARYAFANDKAGEFSSRPSEETNFD
jgi:hypothetical protein